jgi:tRNA A37 threonylcarbamoyltransferase TsaD
MMPWPWLPKRTVSGSSLPTPKLCTDNGAMIAEAGTWALARGERAPLDLSVDPGLPL